MNTYDPKTYELAEYVLKDYVVKDRESAARWIAIRIQRGIDDDIADLERDGHIAEKKEVKVPW